MNRDTDATSRMRDRASGRKDCLGEYGPVSYAEEATSPRTQVRTECSPIHSRNPIFAPNNAAPRDRRQQHCRTNRRFSDDSQVLLSFPRKQIVTSASENQKANANR
ncbi:hypothetical protein PUN28_012493 [Cardiocondyla obscurior]|uniref:Uncharacterized protein n=1 Tax=Cardiocondyla obscurior TaxID=286306 RepID=A0AAW2FEH7_9HYME